MRKRPHRHPVLEAVVFAAALLLALFVGRELWRRWSLRPRPEPVSTGPALVSPIRPEAPPLPGRGRTETAVSSVPPLKLSRIAPKRPKSTVPAPK